MPFAGVPSRLKRGAGLFLLWLLPALLAAAYAQGQWQFREGRYPARFAPAAMPDAGFTFCRMMYERVRMEPMGMGWTTDYPYAEINLMTRLRTDEDDRQPGSSGATRGHWVVRLTDDGAVQLPVRDGVGCRQARSA